MARSTALRATCSREERSPLPAASPKVGSRLGPLLPPHGTTPSVRRGKRQERTLGGREVPDFGFNWVVRPQRDDLHSVAQGHSVEESSARLLIELILLAEPLAERGELTGPGGRVQTCRLDDSGDGEGRLFSRGRPRWEPEAPLRQSPRGWSSPPSGGRQAAQAAVSRSSSPARCAVPVAALLRTGEILHPARHNWPEPD